MTIFRDSHKKNYTCISNHIWKTELGDCARLIYFYALSKPNDWHFNMHDILKHMQAGRDKIYLALKELEEKGYLVRRQQIGEKGRFQNVEWDFHESPQTEEQKELPQQNKLKKKVPHTDSQEAVPFPDQPCRANQEAVASPETHCGKSRARIYIPSNERLSNKTHTQVNTKTSNQNEMNPNSAKAGVCENNFSKEDISREVEVIHEAALVRKIPLEKPFIRLQVSRFGPVLVKKAFATLYSRADETSIAMIKSHPAIFTKTLQDLGAAQC